MGRITFVDLEISENEKILDIGGIKDNGDNFHSKSIPDFVKFLKNTKYLCGHNILNHDIKYLQEFFFQAEINPDNIIDTLFLSTLFFPAKQYHALLKDDKLQVEDLNNPLHDAIKAKDLFNYELTKFQEKDEKLKQIFYFLLKDTNQFKAFFNFLNYYVPQEDIAKAIFEKFDTDICNQIDIWKIVEKNPIELAYCLALIDSQDKYSIIPPWVLKTFPDVDRIMFLLKGKSCLQGCQYCEKALDIHQGLKRYFGFDKYKTFAGQPLQEQAVQAAVDNKSLLTVFPTGGGKSIAFQVPALMSGENIKGLTVIISPLQSLMKDQVDNLENDNITDAVTINSLLDPIERAKSIERVANGSASILYISPESLRYKTTEYLLLKRNVVRFVIDEAHCFSSWGHDFRVDYLYIADFIKLLQEKKDLDEQIPISCFTATAKPQVIDEIKQYFKENLSLDFELFISTETRKNLTYKVFMKKDDEDKYNAIRDLIQYNNVPTIIYTSRTKAAYALAERLSQDGFNAKPYHGKMDKEEKKENQDSFISGKVQIIVATSAFGMGIDKKDVKMIIHHDISDSLESYVQEAGRAGRDENINANCYILFNEEDLTKHFTLLNQTKLKIKDIQQIWSAIKRLTHKRKSMSNSTLEIARAAGWDENVQEIETKVKSAIAALEAAKYVKRKENSPRVYADSILVKNVEDAIEKIDRSTLFNEQQKMNAIRIMKKLISTKNRTRGIKDLSESRVDYICDQLGLEKKDVLEIIYLLREINILADYKDLSVFIKKNTQVQTFVNKFVKIENFLVNIFEQEGKTFHLKELNEQIKNEDIKDVDIKDIKTVMNFLAIKKLIKRSNVGHTKDKVKVICNHPKEFLEKKLEYRKKIATFTIDFLKNKIVHEEGKGKEILVKFSVNELKTTYESQLNMFNEKITLDDIQDTLYYLSKIGAIQIEGGFLVVYHAINVERIYEDRKKQYTNDDYEKLNLFYANKVQKIHIVGEYVNKILYDYEGALDFVKDYFNLHYDDFLKKYFNAERQDEIKRTLTPKKFKKIFGNLSPTQLNIIKDNQSQYIVVAAGPGSGKTRVLVHKLASLLLMEDVRQEQLLMLTFSRAATTEFKERLIQLIGKSAHYVDIKTFHSYCFDLLGRIGDINVCGNIIQEAIQKIENLEIELNKITKTVLVIDEAQDIDEDEFNLINALMKKNENMRVIAVGDDDQNIYDFRGADSKYLFKLINEFNAKKYELIVNYRSKKNLVHFTNKFIMHRKKRLKSMPIFPHDLTNGDIKVVRHQSESLIEPVIQEILDSSLSGSTCVLTKTNNEALQISSLLLKNNVKAKLIQSNDFFNLYHMDEIRLFLKLIDLEGNEPIISQEKWDKAKQNFGEKFRKSTNLDVCKNILKTFESIHTKYKYKSDFEIFLRESLLEDFFEGNEGSILVSTIHKAKGKEFDNVFLMLENFKPDNDEKTRLLYVAMTRAKSKLDIHLRGNFLDNIVVDGLLRVEDKNSYEQPDSLVIDLGYRDIHLSYFEEKQYIVDKLITGDLLDFGKDEKLYFNQSPIVNFSKVFKEKLDGMKEKGFTVKRAKINFIFYWKGEDSEKEIKIILPKLFLERK